VIPFSRVAQDGLVEPGLPAREYDDHLAGIEEVARAIRQARARARERAGSSD